jgi:predicted GIY-YIG superfamily endonuclease
MKKHKVYVIKNKTTDEILYIGETQHPSLRLNNHVCNGSSNGSGTFAGMRDKIKMEIVKEFDERSDAFAYQCKLQTEYGFLSDCEMLRQKCINEHGQYFITLPEVIARRTKTIKEVLGIDIVVYEKKTGKLVKEYQSMNEACIELGVDKRNAVKCLKGIRYKSAGGYIFKYR